MESNPTLDHEQSTSIKYHENQNQNNSFDNSKSDFENSEYKNKNNLRNNHITISSRMKRQISNADSIKDNQDLMLVFGPITKEELTMKWRLRFFCHFFLSLIIFNSNNLFVKLDLLIYLKTFINLNLQKM